MTSDFLAAALAYAERGWHVFPLAEGAKTPDGRLVPRGQNQATTDPQQIRQWWGPNRKANIGIACEPSGLVVVDLDRKPGAADGVAAWETMADDTEFLETYSVTTPTGNGKHLYFLAPDGEKIKNSASKLAPGIDIRGNGYVVAAKSIINGVQYAHNEVPEVQPLPVWVTERLTKPPAAPRVTAPTVAATVAPQGDVQARLQALADELAAAPEGTGNDTAARIAFMAGQYVGAKQLAENEAISVLRAAVSGWAHRDQAAQNSLHTTITNQVREGALTPREWEAPRGRAVPLEALLFPEGASAAPPGAVEVMAVTDWATDHGQARYLYDNLKTKTLYVIGIGWHKWDGQRWKHIDTRHISKLIMAHYKRKFDYNANKAIENAHMLDNEWETKADQYKKLMSTSRMARIITAMECLYPTEASALDAHPQLLNTPNGVVDMKTGETKPHNPRLMLTKITAGNYKPGHTHPDWDAALEAIPADVQQFLQTRIGQAATGHTPESDDLLILVGGGANGKSLMTSDGVMRALGDYAMLASPGLIVAKDTQGGATPERASIRGARFVLIEELPEGRSLSVEEIKRITGTSKITARNLYKNEITFDASHSIFVTTNYLPTVNETDDGAWRRLCAVSFPYKFTGNPTGSDQKKGDPMLKMRVRDGKTGQHDAIITWVIEGARRYLHNVETILEGARPQRVAKDTAAWRGTADRIMSYWTERLMPDEWGAIAVSDLYSDFTAYLAASGHQKWSEPTFSSRLTNHALYRSHNLESARVRTITELSRPPIRERVWAPELPSQPKVIRGIRFRDVSDDALDIITEEKAMWAQDPL